MKNKSVGWLAKSTKKAKRLTPKRYAGEYISTPRLDHNVAAAYNMQRSKTTVGPRENVEPKLDNNFMHPIPETKKGQRSERATVMRTRQAIIDYQKKTLFELYMQLEKGHGVYKGNYFNVVNLGDHYHMLTRGDEAIIVYSGICAKYISITYKGRDAALRAKASGFISWQSIR